MHITFTFFHMDISVNMVNRPVLDVVVLGRFSLYTGWRHRWIRHHVVGLRAYDWLVVRLDMAWNISVPSDDGFVSRRLLIPDRRGHCLAENNQQWFTKKICKNLNSLKINYVKNVPCQRSKILSSEEILFCEIFPFCEIPYFLCSLFSDHFIYFW